MEKYKDRHHAFLVGMLFVLMFLWLSACVCICFVCLSLFVSDGPSVCLCPSVSRGLGVCVSLCFSGLCLSVCLTRTSCVSCFLCLLSVPCGEGEDGSSVHTLFSGVVQVCHELLVGEGRGTRTAGREGGKRRRSKRREHTHVDDHVDGMKGETQILSHGACVWMKSR